MDSTPSFPAAHGVHRPKQDGLKDISPIVKTSLTIINTEPIFSSDARRRKIPKRLTRPEHVYSLGLVVFSLSFLNLPRSSLPATGTHFEVGQVVRAERRLGPFRIGKRTFTVVLRLQKIEGAPDGFEETVESFSIIDDRGEEHVGKAFKIEVGEGRFNETVGLNAYGLESSGKKIFRSEAGGLKEQPLESGETVGLLLYYGYLPSAPSSGLSCQVFVPVDDRLTPSSPPLTVYGNIHDLQKGSQPESRRLGKDETIEFGVWTGWFEVIVPVRVLGGLRIIPLHRHLTFGLDAFSVAVERVPQEEETFVRLFRTPEDTAPAHVVVRKGSTVEFLWAYTRVSLDSGEDEVVISAGEMPWLKVRIDGKEGFVKDEEDLRALGLRPAG